MALKAPGNAADEPSSQHRRGIRYTIPRRRDEHRTDPFDRASYHLRHRVERLINRCQQSRGLATRYDKRCESYRALWVTASILLWIRKLGFESLHPSHLVS